MVTILLAITKIYTMLFYRVKVIGKNNVPQEGPVIICSNHVGELDMFFIGININRLVHWMAKEELFKIKLFSKILKKVGAFPVKRGSGDTGAIKNAVKILEKGNILGIFPQGTRILNNEKKVKAKNGIALILTKVDNVPIVPVALKRNCKLFEKVELIFGEPFYITIDNELKNNKAKLSDTSEYIMNKIYDLLG